MRTQVDVKNQLQVAEDLFNKYTKGKIIVNERGAQYWYAYAEALKWVLYSEPIPAFEE